MSSLTKETRKEGVLRFEITASEDRITGTEWLELGVMTDIIPEDAKVYVERNYPTLTTPKVRRKKISNVRVYWDVYTGGTPTDDYPFWVAPDEAKDWTFEEIMETYARAESYGSEWCMMDYTCELYCDDLLIGSTTNSIESDASDEEKQEIIQALVQWCREEIPYFIRSRQAVIDKLMKVVQDA